jgi:phage tail sheath gpL-like
MVIGKTTLTWKTGAPANENEVRKQTDLATTAENLVVAINAHSVLGNIVVASRSAGVVTITCKVQGEIGNQIALSSSAAGAVASAAYLASGAGGAIGTAVSFSRGY